VVRRSPQTHAGPQAGQHGVGWPTTVVLFWIEWIPVADSGWPNLHSGSCNSVIVVQSINELSLFVAAVVRLFQFYFLFFYFFIFISIICSYFRFIVHHVIGKISQRTQISTSRPVFPVFASYLRREETRTKFPSAVLRLTHRWRPLAGHFLSSSFFFLFYIYIYIIV